MSRPRKKWIGFMKAVVRAYPKHQQELAELRRQSVTAGYGGSPRGRGPGKPVETLALRTLPREDQRELEAVEAAVRETRRLQDGRERLRLIELLYWKGTHTLHGAADVCHVSFSVAKRWNEDFLYLTWRSWDVKS